MRYARQKRIPRLKKVFRLSDDTIAFVRHMADEFDIKVGTLLSAATEYWRLFKQDEFKTYLAGQKIITPSCKKAKENQAGCLIHKDTCQLLLSLASEHNMAMSTILSMLTDYIFQKERESFKQFLLDNSIFLRMEGLL